MEPRRTLLIGFGNPGRGDDGLGPALAEAVQTMGLGHTTVETDYQLAPEHAAGFAEHDVVVFADADAVGPAPYSFCRVVPAAEVSWTTHALEPKALLALAQGIYHREMEAYLLGIRGYRFEPYDESLSEPAKGNLAAALEFLVGVLESGAFGEAATTSEGVK